MVSVIIPTHDRVAKLTRLIDSIEKSTIESKDRETIVVADNCVDDTLTVLTELYPFVKIITAPTTAEDRLVGCSVCRNIGAVHARASIICFVDDDNIVEPNMLEVLVRALINDPTLGAVGPLMMRWPEGSGIWCAGGYVGKGFFTRNKPPERLLEGVDKDGLLEPCDFLPNLFCTRASTLKIVPFDVRAFPHNEAESDWGIRLKSAGFQSRVTTETKTWHDKGYRSITTRISQPALVRDQATARVRRCRKHPDQYGSMLSFWLFWFPVVCVYLSTRFLISGHFWKLSRAFIQGTVEGVRE
ncbi:MAG: glycosyltransferase family A protein [Nitrososphaerales archaeon]|jgi:glycosyltransferase involved in cell wall biosynthesis